MSKQEIRQWAQTIAVIVGVVVALVQLSGLRSDRQSNAAIEIAHSFATPEFVQASSIVLEMPQGKSFTEIDNIFKDQMHLLYHLVTTFETLGILAYEEELSFKLVEEFYGGGIVLSWHKLRPWVDRFRQVNEEPRFAEWFQLLAETLKDLTPIRDEPAYKAYADWKPVR